MNHFAFRETLCPVPIAIRSLYFAQVYIFIPLIHSASFLRFSHILFTAIFSYVYYHANIFLIPDDAVDERKLRI